MLGPFRACFEASTGYGLLYDTLAPIATRVVVAHPSRLRLIFQSRRKTDRIDAAKLARLLLLDQVPTVHVPALDVREWRSLIEHRRGLVDKRTRAKNALRALFRTHGVHSPRGQAMWAKAGRAWASALGFTSELTAFKRDQLIEELEHLGQWDDAEVAGQGGGRAEGGRHVDAGEDLAEGAIVEGRQQALIDLARDQRRTGITSRLPSGLMIETQAAFLLVRTMAFLAIFDEQRADAFFKKLDVLHYSAQSGCRG